MKPVHQTIFSLPLGDCFQASVASILELPLEKVPNFNERGNEWWDAFKQWCAGIGMYPLEINVSEWTNPLRDLDWTTGYWLAGGPGPRGIPHCVVYHGDQLAHDPIPGGNGLEKIEYATALIPLDPVLILAAQKERGAEPVQCAVVPRAEVMDFARQMEVTLRRHDAQRGDSWKREGLPWLSMRVLEEASELREAVKQTPDGGYNDCIPSEAVDVGNMAMMCFSRFHALCPGAHREQEESGDDV